MAVSTVVDYDSSASQLPHGKIGYFEHQVVRIGVIFFGIFAIEQMGNAALPVAWLFLLAGLGYVASHAGSVARRLDEAELARAAQIGDGVLQMMARRRLARGA